MFWYLNFPKCSSRGEEAHSFLRIRCMLFRDPAFDLTDICDMQLIAIPPLAPLACWRGVLTVHACKLWFPLFDGVDCPPSVRCGKDQSRVDAMVSSKPTRE
ncbi:unnamed protein product [Tuber aestivum]|uniref:Uncharacterized protein n=1 Tax=Tuber aestivum TaxID=59557 RepID=A0A292PYQ1_9PEZI|nr:unnamed protein product [Tuber aestivum]